MKRDIFFVIILLLLQGVIATFSTWDAVPVAAATPEVIAKSVETQVPTAAARSKSFTHTPTPTLLAPAPPLTEQPDLADDAPAPVVTGSPTIERVLIVSFDGMRPDAISAAHMANLLNLMDVSAYTLTARTISYPTTLPSHTSMLSGMCMEKHGLGFNSRNLYRGYSQGTDIFDLTHKADMKSVMIVAKDKLEQITAPGTVDIFETYAYEAPIAKAAIKIIPSDFDLMFLHFPSADVSGHKSGWMSNTQLNVLCESDKSLGLVLAALDDNKMRETTLVIVTADHGGHDKTHDGTQLVDYLIPWIVSGPGIVPGKLESSVKIMDTAATVAYALGLNLPPEWDGIPVFEAFGIIPQDIHYRTGPCE
jgi:hypothetical protein